MSVYESYNGGLTHLKCRSMAILPTLSQLDRGRGMRSVSVDETRRRGVEGRRAGRVDDGVCRKGERTQGRWEGGEFAERVAIAVGKR